MEKGSLAYERGGITIHVKKKKRSMVLKWLTTHREKHIQSLPHILGKSKFQVDKRPEYERENVKTLLEKEKENVIT